MGGAMAGGAYLWSQNKAKQQEVYEIVPASYPAKNDTKDAILGWGLETLFGALTGSSTSGASAGGSGAASGSATASQGSAGASTGGSLLDSLLGSILGASGGASSYSGSGGSSVAPNASAILALIRRAEAPQGYNSVYYGSKIQPPRPITTMTVAEVIDYQKRSVSAGSASSAVGAYQFIKSTLSGLVGSTVQSGEIFGVAAQDRAAMALLRRRGFDRWAAGSLSDAQFAQNLSQEWAGLPAFTRDKRGRTATGQSYYAGDGLNAATVSQAQVLAALGASGSGGYA